ncbi:MAG: segregation/condensation protein A [Candidatus Nanohaloarchaeota archaeon QJJ-7]|nr:segregation/condensation protein A [Candidatus Nanohaloarchaeota archaeon QJJ-7]
MKAETTTVTAEKEKFDPHSVETISAGNWEETLKRFTEDMEPWNIDLVKLADRYKSYMDTVEKFDLEVPGRVILVGAVLLRMKAEILRGEEEPEGEFEEQMEFEEEVMEEEEARQLKIPEAVPKPPIKKKGERKVTLDELKTALNKAMEIEDERGERQETRRVEDYGIDVEEKDFTDRLESMYSNLKSYVNGGKDALTFSELAEQEEQRETIEQFVNLMHLETEERVQCYQEEWLGEIEIELLEQENN